MFNEPKFRGEDGGSMKGGPEAEWTVLTGREKHKLGIPVCDLRALRSGRRMGRDMRLDNELSPFERSR